MEPNPKDVTRFAHWRFCVLHEPWADAMANAARELRMWPFAELRGRYGIIG